MEKKLEETGRSASTQDKSSSPEKAQGKKMVKKETFEERMIGKLCSIEMGALYAGAENLILGLKKIDAKLTVNADSYSSKITDYFRNSINTHKKKKSK